MPNTLATPQSLADPVRLTRPVTPTCRWTTRFLFRRIIERTSQHRTAEPSRLNPKPQSQTPSGCAPSQTPSGCAPSGCAAAGPLRDARSWHRPRQLSGPDATTQMSRSAGSLSGQSNSIDRNARWGVSGTIMIHHRRHGISLRGLRAPRQSTTGTTHGPRPEQHCCSS